MNTKIVSELLSNEDGSIQDECIVRLRFVQTMSGDELVDFIEKGVEGDVNDLKDQLSYYDKASLFKIWFNYVRHVEEFINIRNELDKRAAQIFDKIHIGNECEMNIISSSPHGVYSLLNLTPQEWHDVEKRTPEDNCETLF